VITLDWVSLPGLKFRCSPTKSMLSAHDSPKAALAVNPHINCCVATDGNDQHLKVCNELDDGDPKCNVSLITGWDVG
ncbi:hypothetical protein B0H13DRAFT_1527081, partial [Mycena leptocephala]